MGLSTMIGTKKNIQLDILVFLEAQEIHLTGNLRDSECHEFWIFLLELFSFYKKVSSPLDLAGFFQSIFIPTTVMFSIDLH